MNEASLSILSDDVNYQSYSIIVLRLMSKKRISLPLQAFLCVMGNAGSL